MEMMNSDLLKYIKSNAKYQGNEDLCEDFLAESLRRSYSVLESVDDISFIEPYLKKVVNTSILTVLKNSGRVQRIRNSFVSVPKVISFDELESAIQIEPQTRKSSEFTVENIPDPKVDFSETVANKDLLTQVCNAVLVANSTDKSKRYYDIFVKRYVDLKKQSEIAQELEISQSQVCKRIYELVQIIKNDVIGY